MDKRFDKHFIEVETLMAKCEEYVRKSSMTLKIRETQINCRDNISYLPDRQKIFLKISTASEDME